MSIVCVFVFASTFPQEHVWQSNKKDEFACVMSTYLSELACVFVRQWNIDAFMCSCLHVLNYFPIWLSLQAIYDAHKTIVILHI